MPEQILLNGVYNPTDLYSNESLLLLYNMSNLEEVGSEGGNEASSNNGRAQEDKTFRNTIIICCYSLIVLVSLCGNLLVCKVAFGKRKMRTTTNMLIASLACSDLVMTAFNIPFNVARLLLLNWPFGSILCFLVPFIQTSCVYVSTFTMTLIAVHRWWTVSKSTNSRNFNCFRLIAVILVIWLLAAVLSLPHAIFNHIKQALLFGKLTNRCRASYPELSFDLRLFLSVEIFITQYLTPLLITLLAMVVLVFALCWLPINIYHLLVDFKLVKHNFTLFLVVHWFAMSSVCYNPFIYCWLNESFRKGAKKFFLIFFKCRQLKPNQRPEVVETHEEEGKLHTTVTAIDPNNGKRVSV